jgi:sRNA-binding protein
MEAFAELRRNPTAGVDHTCEHCGHRYAATLAGGSEIAPEKTPVPTPVAAEARIETAAQPPAPFQPKATPAGPEAPPFGLLAGRNEGPSVRQDAAVGAPPPFAAGPTTDTPNDTGKKSLQEWWKSQSPKRQWTFLACFVLMIGAAIVSLDGDSAKASAGAGKGKKSAKVKKKEEAKKSEQPKAEPTIETKSKAPAPQPNKEIQEAAAKETKPVNVDEAMGLLCAETTTLVGKIETPLAAVWAVEGKGFIARGAKVWSDLQSAKGSMVKWTIITPTKRYKVAKVRFHREFPAEQLKTLLAKGATQEMVKLIASAERSDLALIETTEAPTTSINLGRDPEAVSGKTLEIATPTDPKPSRPGQAMTVKFGRTEMKATMLSEEGVGLKVTLPVGTDAVVMTNDGVLAAFVPRKHGSPVHPIVAAETVAELIDGK